MSRHQLEPGPVTRATEATTVRLERRAKARFSLNGTLETEAWANVPVTVIHHSPTGYEWGYSGSGPSDLALNILNWFVPPGADGLERVKCWKGHCSRTAWVLHHVFKNEVLAAVPAAEDYTLAGERILAWIATHRFCKVCSRVLAVDPEGTCVCGHRLTGPCACHWCVCTRELEALEEESDGRTDRG